MRIGQVIRLWDDIDFSETPCITGVLVKNLLGVM